MQRGEVLAQAVRRHGLPIALHVERARDHLTLALRQLTRIVATASTATTGGLGLLVRLVEAPDGHEVDVRLRFLTAAAVVPCAGVIRHEVAGLEPVFLEEERVSGDDFTKPLPAGVQRDRLLGPAVHRIHQVDVRHTVVIRRLHLREHFFDSGDLRVTTGLLELDRRWTIVEHVDRVVQRAWNELARLRLQLELVEAVCRDLDGA